MVTGDANEIKKARVTAYTRLRWLGDSFITEMDSTSEGKDLGELFWFCDMDEMMPSTTVGAGETCEDIGGFVDRPPSCPLYAIESAQENTVLGRGAMDWQIFQYFHMEPNR